MAMGAAKSIFELALKKQQDEDEELLVDYKPYPKTQKAQKQEKKSEAKAMAEPITTGIALGGLLKKYAAPFALQGIGRLFGMGSANREARRQREAQLAALKPYEAQVQALNFGPTASEGGLFKALERRALTSLGRRGVLRGSTAPAEVAAAMAPAEMQFQQRREDANFRLAALRARIEGGTTETGYGDAFGQTLGDAGSFIAQSMATKDTISLLHKMKILGLEERA